MCGVNQNERIKMLQTIDIPGLPPALSVSLLVVSVILSLSDLPHSAHAQLPSPSWLQP